MEDLKKSLEELNNALESTEGMPMTALQVEDLTERARRYLSEKSMQILYNDVKPKALWVKDKETGRLAFAKYFSVIVNDANVDRALLVLSASINDLVAKGYVHSFLAPLSSIKLAREFGHQPSNAVFVFPMIYKEYTDEVTQYPFNHEEGQLGNTLGYRYTVLKPGEFLANIRLSPAAVMLDSGNKEDRLHETIQEYLQHLPKGTSVVSIDPLAVVDLSLPYEVKFYNSLFQDIKKVELQYRRSIARIDGELIQFNLFKGIDYYASLDQKTPNP